MARNQQQQNRPGPLDRLGALFTGKQPEQSESPAAPAPDAVSPSESPATGLQPPASPPTPVPPAEPTPAEKQRAYMLDRTNVDKAQAAGQVLRVDPLPSAVQSLEARKQQSQPVGKKCQNRMCQSMHTKVVQTRTLTEGVVRRERECAVCGHRWWTEEK